MKYEEENITQTIVDGLTDIEEMYVMSLCDHFIIGSSTFSWWAAVIGKSDIEEIIMPKPWNIRQINETNYLKLPDVTYSEAIFQK